MTLPYFLDYVVWISKRAPIGVVVFGLLETAIHELGHVICGLACGVVSKEIRVGGGPTLTIWRSKRLTVRLGLVPGDGFVDFQVLPISRRQRILMYAGGLGATFIAAVIGWFLLSPGVLWLRVCFVAVFGSCLLGNLFGKAPADEWTDVRAIRGLLRYGRA